MDQWKLVKVSLSVLPLSLSGVVSGGFIFLIKENFEDVGTMLPNRKPHGFKG
jgi:hypothetical protein